MTEGSEPESTLLESVFFGGIVSASMIGHIKHLQQEGEGSFAAHLALKEFYKESVKIADAVIETYQGYKKQITTYDLEFVAELIARDVTALEYLEGLREGIQTNRYEVIPKEESHIHNELDNMVALIDGTIYKLTFLK